MSQVVGEKKVTCKRVCEGLVEVEHLEQFVSLDGVQVTVGEGSDVGRRLTHATVLPERVAKHVALACTSKTSQQ